MTLNIRPYKSEDEALAIDLWNDSLTRDQIDRKIFYNRIIYDVNFDPANYLLAFEGDVPVGFIYCTRRIVHDEISGLEPTKGWIVAMGVHPNFRRRGIGRKLVEKVESNLTAAGVTQIDLATYTTNYFFPGVDKIAYESGVNFFEALEYENRGECVSMEIDLHDYVYPEKYKEKRKMLEMQGYVIKPFEPCDAVATFVFLRECFPDWLPLVRASAISGKGEERVIVAKDKTGHVVGFVMRGMDGTAERFGPFGVKPDQQGCSLGSILFNEMMLSMVRQRIFHAYFMWGEGRNREIYASWGMKIFRQYCQMSKKF